MSFKKYIFILIVISAAILSCMTNARASDNEGHGGFLAGAGPALGFESNELITVGGGASFHLGYQISERFAGLINSDLLYTRDAGVDFLLIPVSPTVQISIYENFYGYIGGGYTFMWASSGAKPGSGGNATPSKSYNGWNVVGGFGYDFWWRDNLTISPQIGIIYSRIASSNFIFPLTRVNFTWIF